MRIGSASATNGAPRTTLITRSVASAAVTLMCSPGGVAEAQDATAPAFEEVIVTAQKRSENVQNVPISISAISESFIQEVGAQSVNDLGLYTPGLETRVSQPTQPAFNIRGITTNDFGIGADPAVAVYVDGVYSGRSGAAMTAFQDVSRVEVLKGPQGTLFGKNAAAGALHIVSNAPTDELEATVNVNVGNYDRRTVEATFNAPLADNLFLRINAMDNQRDGYRRNLATGSKLADENNNGVRAALLWQASASTSATLRMEYLDVDQDAAIGYGLLNGGDPYGDAVVDAPVREALHLAGGSLTVESDLGATSLTSITAAREFGSRNLRDEDGTAVFPLYFTSENVEDNRLVSQELRLVSDDSSKLRWTVGAMYSRERGQQDSALNFSTDLIDRVLLSNAAVATGLDIYNAIFGTSYTAATAPAGFGWDIVLDPMGENIINWGTPLGAGQSVLGGFFPENAHADLTSTSAAVYGDATYALTEKTDLTVGLRYTRDEKDFTLTIVPNQFGFGVVYNTTPGVMQSNRWSNLSTRAVLSHRFAEETMAYASYATGYKAGGFNSTELSNPFDEEQVTNYEIGLKSTPFERLRFNAAVFFYEYTDLQELVSVLNPDTGINEPRIRNEDAEGRGVEIETQWRVLPEMTLSANYAYLDTEITKFALFATETAADDRTGQPQSSVAKQKYNLSAEYTLALQSAGDVSFRVGFTHVGRRRTQGLGGATPEAQALMDVYRGDLDDPYNNVDARITYSDASGRWHLSAYGQNLTNEEYLYNLGGFAAGIGSPIADRAPPRFFGVEAAYSFPASR
jgi:iron complex outermembrane recepter protein